MSSGKRKSSDLSLSSRHSSSNTSATRSLSGWKTGDANDQAEGVDADSAPKDKMLDINSATSGGGDNLSTAVASDGDNLSTAAVCRGVKPPSLPRQTPASSADSGSEKQEETSDLGAESKAEEEHTAEVRIAFQSGLDWLVQALSRNLECESIEYVKSLLEKAVSTAGNSDDVAKIGWDNMEKSDVIGALREQSIKEVKDLILFRTMETMRAETKEMCHGQNTHQLYLGAEQRYIRLFEFASELKHKSFLKVEEILSHHLSQLRQISKYCKHVGINSLEEIEELLATQSEDDLDGSAGNDDETSGQFWSSIMPSKFDESLTKVIVVEKIFEENISDLSEGGVCNRICWFLQLVTKELFLTLASLDRSNNTITGLTDMIES